MRPLLEQQYPNDVRAISRKAGEIRDFILRMQDDDVVIAADGERVLGIGRTTGPYRMRGRAHRCTSPPPCEVDFDRGMKLPAAEGLRTTFFPIGRHMDNIVEIERRLLEGVNVLRLGLPLSRRPARRASMVSLAAFKRS